MEEYIIMKAVGDSIRTYVVKKAEKGKRKSFIVSGNLPELYGGMTIFLELEETYVTDYILEPTDRNISILIKHNTDIKKYGEAIDRHQMLKEQGLSWSIAKSDMPQIYDILSFSDADKVHKEMINNAQAPERIKAINKRIIEGARRRKKIDYSIEEYLSYFDETEQKGAYQRLLTFMKIDALQSNSYRFSGGRIIDSEMKQKEDFIKSDIAERLDSEYSLLTKSEIQKYLDKINDSGLSEEQKAVMWCLVTSCPCIVTGGAGTGKTTVIKNIIECYSTYYNKKNILLVAPTGKASRRLAEKTGMPASTIHKALRKSPEDDFVYYTAENPLPHRLIIIDESSMIDTELMYDLLSAVDRTSKVIFAGDCNQLEPVGYGEPFFDFMNTLEVFRLTENHRQSDDTDILLMAENALNGRKIYSGRGVIVRHIDFDEIGDILTTDDDVQILSPYNELNAEINYFLRKGENDLNVNDKVIMLKNTKDYCNGDIGFITAIDRKGITVDIEGRKVKVTPAKRNHISLAYSITIHKMQGSESDRVIVFIPEGYAPVSRRMMYTAVTRAKKELEIYYYKRKDVNYVEFS